MDIVHIIDINNKFKKEEYKMAREIKSDVSKAELEATGWKEDGKTWFPGYLPAGTISSTVTSDGVEYCYVFTSRTRKLRFKAREQEAIRMKHIVPVSAA